MRRISVAVFATILVCGCGVLAQQSDNSASTAVPVLPAGTVTGSGTTNYIPMWTSSSALGDSVMYQTLGDVGIGTTKPAVKLDVNGIINAAMNYRIGGNTVLSIGSAADDNLFVGVGAGAHDVAGKGFDNVLAGFQAGYSNTTGNENSFFGYNAGYSNTSGAENVFFGLQAGYNNTTGILNTFYGYDAGILNTTGSYDVYIANEGPSSGSESYTIRIGDVHQTAAYVAGIFGSTSSSGIPVYINSEGQLGTSSSSARFKEQVRDMGDTTDALMKLRPVTFVYKPEYQNGERTLQYGLIAEEVAKVYPELVAYDNRWPAVLGALSISEHDAAERSAEAIPPRGGAIGNRRYATGADQNSAAGDRELCGSNCNCRMPVYKSDFRGWRSW